MTEWSPNLTRLIGITSIFAFDLFGTKVVQTDSRIVRRDQYLRQGVRARVRFGEFDRALTRQWFEFIVSIPVILYGFRHFFLERWLRLPSLSPMFITVWKQNRTDLSLLGRFHHSHRTVTDRCKVKTGHRRFQRWLCGPRHRNAQQWSDWPGQP